jgi:hypothetical protein
MTGIPDDHATTNKAFPFTDKALGGFGDWKDELNRQKFCNQVGSLLLEHRSPEGITISIEGEWGSGKSSALAMIKAFLTIHKQDLSSNSSGSLTRITKFKRWLRRQRRKSPLTPEDCTPILVEFNPWLVGAADHMIQAFIAQIASELGQVNHNAKATEAAQRLIAYAQLLEPLKWIPGAEPWTSIAKGIVEKTGQGVKKVSDLHKLNISKQRDALKKTLLELGRNIIIFIDDIDRLPPAEVFQIVRAIQAVSDLPRCSFVIALDPFYTEKALQAAASFENPGQYLDKIVQLRLFLPRVNKADLESYFQKRLLEALSPLQEERFPIEQKRLSQIWQLGVKPLIQTPRDVIRIINRFLYIEPWCGREVCWGDLLGLQTIAIILPDLFRNIMQNPGAYTGIDMADTYQRGGFQEHIDKFADERTNVLKSLTANRQAQAQRLLEELFPLLRSYSYDKLTQKEFSKSRRIAASDRLKIALTYDLPSDEVSLSDIESFCYESKSRDDVIKKILARDLLDHFLEAVLQKIDPLSVRDQQEFVFFLGRLVENQHINSNFQGFRSLFMMATIDKIILLAEKVLSRPSDDADDLAGLSVFASDSSILSLGTHLLARRLKERTQHNESRVEKSLIQVSEEPVLQQWLETSVSTLRNQAFLGIADKWIVIRFLLSMKEGREQLPELLRPYLDSNNSIDAIADVFISSQTESTEGMSVACSNEYLAMLGNSETIHSKAENRLRDPSVQSNRKLCAIYKSIVHGKKFYIDETGQAQEWDE